MLHEREDEIDIEVLETEMLTIIHPVNLFKGWTDDEFREWLRLDKYCQIQEQPTEENVISVLNMIEPFPELGNFYDICLETLIKITKNES